MCNSFVSNFKSHSAITQSRIRHETQTQTGTCNIKWCACANGAYNKETCSSLSQLWSAGQLLDWGFRFTESKWRYNGYVSRFHAVFVASWALIVLIWITLMAWSRISMCWNLNALNQASMCWSSHTWHSQPMCWLIQWLCAWCCDTTYDKMDRRCGWKVN